MSTALRRVARVPPWATVVLTLGTGLIGGGFAYAVARMNLRDTQEARHTAEWHEWREKGAQAIAPVFSILRDSEPKRMAINMRQPSTSEQVSDLFRRWNEARAEIELLAVSHPNPQIEEQASTLLPNVHNALISLSYLVAGEHVGTADELERAKDDYEDALREAKAMRQEIREGWPPHEPLPPSLTGGRVEAMLTRFRMYR